MQSHPLSSAFRVAPHRCLGQPLNHNITVTAKEAPQGSARYCIFQSFLVLLAGVLQCFLSPLKSFAVINQRLGTAHKREIIKSMWALHTASLTLCVHSID